MSSGSAIHVRFIRPQFDMSTPSFEVVGSMAFIKPASGASQRSEPCEAGAPPIKKVYGANLTMTWLPIREASTLIVVDVISTLMVQVPE